MKSQRILTVCGGVCVWKIELFIILFLYNVESVMISVILIWVNYNYILYSLEFYLDVYIL